MSKKYNKYQYGGASFTTDNIKDINDNIKDNFNTFNSNNPYSNKEIDDLINLINTKYDEYVNSDQYITISKSGDTDKLLDIANMMDADKNLNEAFFNIYKHITDNEHLYKNAEEVKNLLIDIQKNLFNLQVKIIFNFMKKLDGVDLKPLLDAMNKKIKYMTNFIENFSNIPNEDKFMKESETNRKTREEREARQLESATNIISQIKAREDKKAKEKLRKEEAAILAKAEEETKAAREASEAEEEAARLVEEASKKAVIEKAARLAARLAAEKKATRLAAEETTRLAAAEEERKKEAIKKASERQAKRQSSQVAGALEKLTEIYNSHEPKLQFIQYGPINCELDKYDDIRTSFQESSKIFIENTPYKSYINMTEEQQKLVSFYINFARNLDKVRYVEDITEDIYNNIFNAEFKNNDIYNMLFMFNGEDFNDFNINYITFNSENNKDLLLSKLKINNFIPDDIENREILYDNDEQEYMYKSRMFTMNQLCDINYIISKLSVLINGSTFNFDARCYDNYYKFYAAINSATIIMESGDDGLDYYATLMENLNKDNKITKD